MDARHISRTAPAKLNLWLRVTGRRADGYHLLDTLVAFAAVGDTVEATESDRLALAVDGPFAAGLGTGDDNIVHRAAARLAAHAGMAPLASIRLHKRLPVAAGIGGGSADAAATLALLAELWRLPLASEALHRIGEALGADVPMCLAGQPSYVSGVGELLEPAPELPSCGVILVNPGRPLLTADVFRARAGAPFRPPAERLGPAPPDLGRLCAAIEEAGNDLLPPALTLVPEIGEVLDALRQCRTVQVASMSGSGATCFALCASPAQASDLAGDLRRERPAWWSWGGGWA